MFYGGEFENVGLNASTSASAARATTQAQQAATAVKDLQFELDRLKLLNQAMWELLQERTGLNEEQFNKKVQEVDMRDGVADGTMTTRPLQCPSCNRVSNSKHYRCLYCGMLFEKPAFG